jgi:flagellar biosynthesis protein FlhA
LKPGEYVIQLKGNEIARGELMTNYYLAMNPGHVDEKIDGLETSEPTYGLPALWIKKTVKEEALSKGYTVVDLATILTTHLSEIIRRHSHELLGRQEVQRMLDQLKNSHPKVVEELVPNLLPLGGVVKVLQNLLREQVPIRDLLVILESLADWAATTKDPEVLTEHVRQAMARTLTKLHQDGNGELPVVNLGHSVESAVANALQQSEHGSFMALDPAAANQMMSNLARCLEKAASMNYQPVVLCSPQIRLHMKKIVDRFIPNVCVLSYNEILPGAEIIAIATVELNDAD